MGFFADLVQRESCVPCSGEGAVPGDEKRKVVANSGEPAFAGERPRIMPSTPASQRLQELTPSRSAVLR